MSQLNSSSNAKANTFIQTARILHPAVCDSLPLIFNQLDSISFVKLARTCRTMQDICFNTKLIDVRFGNDYRTNGIPFNDSCVIAQEVYVLGDDSKPEGFRFEQLKVNSLDDTWYDISEEQVERMWKIPFLFVIDCLCFCDCLPVLNARRMEALRQHLRHFRLIIINSIVLSTNTSDWNTLAELVRLVKFNYGGYVSDDVILAANAKDLHFEEAKISVDTLKGLLKKFSADEMQHWTIGRERSMRRDPDPFFDDCADVMIIVVVRDVDAYVKDPGVLYTSHHSLGNFSLLRDDGSIGRLHIGRHNVVFN